MSDLPPRVLLSTSNFSSHSCPLLSVSPPLLSLSLKFLSPGRELSLLSLSPTPLPGGSGHWAHDGGQRWTTTAAIPHFGPRGSSQRAQRTARGSSEGTWQADRPCPDPATGSQFRQKPVEFREISRFRQSLKVEAV